MSIPPELFQMINVAEVKQALHEARNKIRGTNEQ